MRDLKYIYTDTYTIYLVDPGGGQSFATGFESVFCPCDVVFCPARGGGDKKPHRKAKHCQYMCAMIVAGGAREGGTFAT